MKAVMNSLPLQALLVLWIICSANGAPYSSESHVSITPFTLEWIAMTRTSGRKLSYWLAIYFPPNMLNLCWTLNLLPEWSISQSRCLQIDGNSSCCFLQSTDERARTSDVSREKFAWCPMKAVRLINRRTWAAAVTRLAKKTKTPRIPSRTQVIYLDHTNRWDFEREGQGKTRRFRKL